ncbi:MAG: hypothetical protein FJ395_13845 [Verrucomicrobia bacterium]|nr:hypothetical protein [Verrucomicrobiota bacterium]
MKFLLDAQLPRRLARALAAGGHDTVHCLDLALGNRTPDQELATIAARESRVLVTKDSDFVTSYWLQGMPPKLLLISTGNIDNDALLRLVAANQSALIAALTQHHFVELSRSSVTVHA